MDDNVHQVSQSPIPTSVLIKNKIIFPMQVLYVKWQERWNNINKWKSFFCDFQILLTCLHLVGVVIILRLDTYIAEKHSHGDDGLIKFPKIINAHLSSVLSSMLVCVPSASPMVYPTNQRDGNPVYAQRPTEPSRVRRSLWVSVKHFDWSQMKRELRIREWKFENDEFEDGNLRIWNDNLPERSWKQDSGPGFGPRHLIGSLQNLFALWSWPKLFYAGWIFSLHEPKFTFQEKSYWPRV